MIFGQQLKDEILETLPPFWWNLKGYDIGVNSRHTKMHELELVLSTRRKHVAKLTITPFTNKFHPGNKYWKLAWQLSHTPYSKVNGTIIADTLSLESAFMIRDQGEKDVYPVACYGIYVAVSRVFIRRGPHLCIPGPGSTKNGDPNLSIYITNDIIAAVQQLISLR